MRVLVAPDCFAGTLTAGQAAQAIAEGWHRRASRDHIEQCPLSDGGPGFADVLHQVLGGELLAVTVTGPLGDPVTAGVLLARSGDGVLTGYVESATACGLHLVPVDRRDPGLTTTAGVGELLLAADAAGARRIVVGVGGSGTNDAGAGLLAALWTASGDAEPGPHARLAGGGAALFGIRSTDLAGLAAVVERWRRTEIVVATDVDVPLLGLQGASAGFAEQKGASPRRAQELERCLGDFAHSATAVLGLDGRMTATPGAGAGGGLSFALMLLGANRIEGAAAVLSAVGFADRLRRCDLVVTGEGCFDWQSLRGKVVAGVAREALLVGKPVIVVAGQVQVGRREIRAIGVEAAYPVARTPDEVAACLADPRETLAARAERVARTWSR